MTGFFDHVRRFALAASLLAAASLAVPAQAAPREIEADGPYLHRPANAVFPERVGEFKRLSLHEYDESGRDVSASYDMTTSGGRLVVTVYIYPAPQMSGDGDAGKAARITACDQHFAGVHQIIADNNGNARPIDQGRALAVADVPAELSHRYTYRFRARFDDGEQEVRSEAHLYCYVGGNWLVKYRATAPVAVEGQEAIAEFIRRGPWPGRGSAETLASAN